MLFGWMVEWTKGLMIVLKVEKARVGRGTRQAPGSPSQPNSPSCSQSEQSINQSINPHSLLSFLSGLFNNNLQNNHIFFFFFLASFAPPHLLLPSQLYGFSFSLAAAPEFSPYLLPSLRLLTHLFFHPHLLLSSDFLPLPFLLFSLSLEHNLADPASGKGRHIPCLES